MGNTLIDSGPLIALFDKNDKKNNPERSCGIMENVIPKTKLKILISKLLKEIEETGIGVIITDKGKPVARIIRYTDDSSDIPKSLRNSVISYDAPTMPVGLEDWEALK